MTELWIDLARKRRILVGREVLLLASEPADWIQRRVETLDVSSLRLVRRTVGVDLVLPDADARKNLRVFDDEHAPLIVPLGLLRKRQLIDFDLAEGRDPRMLVTSAINTLIASGALWDVAFFVDEVEVEAADAALPWFERIVGAEIADADTAFDELFGPDGGVRLPAQARPVADALETRAIAAQLRESYLLLVELPETGQRHRLLRFATDQIVAPTTALGWRERLGVRRSVVGFDVPGGSQAASYHAEVTVPEGCALADVQLADGNRRVDAATQTLGSRATLYPRTPVGPAGEMKLGILHERAFFFLPAAVIATLLSLVVLSGGIVVLLGGQPEATAATVVISGFGAMSGLVIRTGELPLTRELHSAARLLLALVAVVALVAAAAVAFGAVGTLLGVIWVACGGISAAMASTLWSGFAAGYSARMAARSR